MDKRHEELVGKCNSIIGKLIEVKELWEELVESGYSTDRIKIEQCPIAFQTFFAMFGQSDFSTAMPRLINHAQAYGGLEIFLSETDEEDKEEVKEEVDNPMAQAFGSEVGQLRTKLKETINLR